MLQLSVATFNTHQGVDHRGRLFDVGAVCADLAADVIVLQEAWSSAKENDVARLAADLGFRLDELIMSTTSRRIVNDGGRRRRELGTIGIAVLTRLPVIAAGRIALGRAWRDGVKGRGALTVTVDAGGTAVTVVGTHLPHITQGSHLQLRRLLRSLPDTTTPAVLTGDMNMWGPILVPFLPGWRRAVVGRTWPSRWPHSQIDHLLVTPPVQVVRGEVLGPTGSDHRPVRADLAV